MKDFWKKHKISLVIGGFLLIVLPLLYLIASVMLKRIQAKADLVQERIVEQKLEKLKIEKIPGMEKADAKFEENKAALETILNFEDKVDFIEYIESLAEKTNNKIKLKVLADSKIEESPGAKKEKETPAQKNDQKTIKESLLYQQYILMQVDLEGDYAGFLDFVHKLENNKYYVNIISFNLQKVFVKKEKLLEKSNSSFGEIFFSPKQSEVKNNYSKVELEGDPMLRSVLNIIIYTE